MQHSDDSLIWLKKRKEMKLAQIYEKDLQKLMEEIPKLGRDEIATGEKFDIVSDLMVILDNVAHDYYPQEVDEIEIDGDISSAAIDFPYLVQYLKPLYESIESIGKSAEVPNSENLFSGEQQKNLKAYWEDKLPITEDSISKIEIDETGDYLNIWIRFGEGDGVFTCATSVERLTSDVLRISKLEMVESARNIIRKLIPWSE